MDCAFSAIESSLLTAIRIDHTTTAGTFTMLIIVYHILITSTQLSESTSDTLKVQEHRVKNCCSIIIITY